MTQRHLFGNLWIALDKTLGAAVLVGVFCLIFLVAHRAIFDADIWLHLKTGEFILQNKVVPSRDIFSVTLEGKSWIDHEWLFQVTSYLIYQRWQAEGLISLACYIIFLSFFVLFLMGYREIKSYMETAVFILLAAYACFTRFNIRPEIFSLLFFSLFLYLLRFQVKKKIIWLLIPLQVFWVNFHGYFFLGPLVTFLFVAAEFLRRRLSLPWQWNKEFALGDAEYAHLKKALLFVLLACMINPRGWAGALYPISVFKGIIQGETQVFFRYIQELRPTFRLASYPGDSYHLLIFFCFGLMAINFKKLKLVEIFLVAFFFIFALTLRNVAFFAFVGYLIIVSYIGPTLKNISTKIKLETPLRQLFYFLFRFGLAIFLLVWIGLRINRIIEEADYDFKKHKIVSLVSGVDEKRYPKGAVDFLTANKIQANLFNDFNSGAYTIFMTHPKIRVFIDGRTELYGANFFKQYQAALRADKSVFEGLVDKYKISAVLLGIGAASNCGIAKYIYQSPQWKLVFLDESGVIFLKDIPQNEVYINKFKVDLVRYQTPQADLHILGLQKVYPSPYIKRASLFASLQEDALVIQEAKEALRIMPNCAGAYHLLGKAYLRKSAYPEAYENLRAALLLGPGNVGAMVDLATALLELKEEKSARNLLKGAIRINKRYAPAYYQLANLYLLTFDYDEAIRALNKAIKYAPQDATYHFKLGEVFYEKCKESKEGNFLNQAKDEFKKAAKLNIQADLDLAMKIQAKLEEVNSLP